MLNNDYIPRLLDEELDFYLKCVGAVVIVGPKFCGKSTTANATPKQLLI